MSFACNGPLQPHGPRIRSLLSALAIFTASVSVLTSGVARAEPGLEPGEAYVARFSGTTTEAGKTVIDTGGTVGSVIDIRNPAQAPRGQHWLNEPQHNPVTAGEVGQVFGVTLNGESRAYPLRIMDWHEMANDVVGGVPVALAY